MATYRLYAITPAPAGRRSGPAPRVGWRWAVVPVALVLAACAAGGAARSYAGSPERAAERFLAAYRAGDTHALAALMDDSFAHVFAPAAASDLLRYLHRPLPANARLVASGRVSMDGQLTDRQR